jgi:DNA-binding Lrp family transcriptional regulator
MMQGFPISAKLPEDLGFGERFWYWRGASGRSYIHSIYQAESCPPLAGAVFVLVRVSNGRRRAVAVGRFPECVEGRSDLSFNGNHRAEEIHVHLLARDREAACAVLRDLEDALHGTVTAAPQLELELAVS